MKLKQPLIIAENIYARVLLRHFNTAFTNFFPGRSKYPQFKKKAHPQSATYARSAFTWQDGKLTLAKMKQPLKIR